MGAKTTPVIRCLAAAAVTSILLVTTGSVTAASAAGSDASSKTACSGVRSCKVVKKVDVDGDGRADSVGIITKKIDRSGTVQVRVLTAKKRLITKTVKGVDWYGKPSSVWHGAAAIDGKRGAELVIGQEMGAHYLTYTVLTYRSGKLVVLRAPKAPNAASRTASSTKEWGTDSSWSFNIGIARTSGGTKPTIKTTVCLRDFEDPGHECRVSTYRWNSSKWVLTSSKKVQYSDRKAFDGGGWHVKGLRVQP